MKNNPSHPISEGPVDYWKVLCSKAIERSSKGWTTTRSLLIMPRPMPKGSLHSFTRSYSRKIDLGKISKIVVYPSLCDISITDPWIQSLGKGLIVSLLL